MIGSFLDAAELKHAAADGPGTTLPNLGPTRPAIMNLSRAAAAAYLLLRVVAGLLFIQTGGLILFGWFGGMPGQPPGHGPSLLSEFGLGGILEFFGGIAIVLGLGTRPVAFILSGMMAVAYWQFHAPNSPWPAQNQGMPAILFCFLYLFMAAQGGGEWSLDARLKRRAPDAAGRAHS